MSSARVLLRTATGAYLALLALLLLWLTWLAPPSPEAISLTLLLVVGPLLLPLRGLLHGRRYTVAWSTLLILLYVVHGVGAMAGGGRALWLGGGEIALSVVYFCSAIGYVRRSNPKRQNKP
jgi:uncharacterized membrane protein